MHYDMFAGTRNMQRAYCALFATDAAHANPGVNMYLYSLYLESGREGMRRPLICRSTSKTLLTPKPSKPCLYN